MVEECRELRPVVEHVADGGVHQALVQIVSLEREQVLAHRLNLRTYVLLTGEALVLANKGIETLIGAANRSDALEYLPLCDAAYEVSNLAQLTDAVDRLLSGR